MFGRLSCFAAAVVCLLLADGGASLAQSAASPAAKIPSPAQAQTQPQTLSPLHAFLGIDPVTGEFKPPSAGPPKIARPASSVALQPAAKAAPGDATPAISPAQPAPAGTTLGEILSRAADSGDLPAGDTPIGDTTVDELRTALVKAVDERDDQALTAAINKVATNFGYGEVATPALKYAEALTLIFFLYPLGILIGAFYAAWVAGRQHLRTDRDRRHERRQLRRRLTLAASTAGTIGLFWWAGERDFWWSEPQKLIAAGVALTLLLLVSATLRMLIRRSANDYSQRTIEELRFQHAALCDEVKELRKRLGGEGLPETV